MRDLAFELGLALQVLLASQVAVGKQITGCIQLAAQLRDRGLALLLVPKSVARQWQEELYEKFVLDVPLYEGGRFRNYAGEELEWQHDTDNPWDAFDLMIASSQLAKRRERHDQIVAACPWDVVLVDEAHHARRRDFLQPTYRPNRLLSLLTDPRFRATSILLMTATPMQVHALEVWDLLKVLGLGGKWGADDAYFLAFYGELMKPFEDVDWDFVFAMVRDYLEFGGTQDDEFATFLNNTLGYVDANYILGLPYTQNPSRSLRQLASHLQPYVFEMARRHTPLHGVMFRNTRDLLRKYVRAGILDAKVPEREPKLVWIPMSKEEMALYLRIEKYITHFYRRYEGERKGLGFVMTVYRRRLTSSFYAVRQSLERRLDFLEGRLPRPFDEEDLEQEDLEQDVTDLLDQAQQPPYQEEIDYVREFINDLKHLSTHDSKVEQLIQDLTEVFRQRDTAIVFTQYADTMDYLRDKLRQVYGDQVACYSGRGGEVWNGIAWIPVTKEDIKQAFREGEDIKILVCTEAASEGLNLQTCGVLINYDMPWNPMRVEQRIGRIDRIGQVYDEVWIRNYFYEETIEAQVYRALSTRINWFEGIVGELQPILARVGRAIERLVMATQQERDALLSNELSEIEASLDQQEGDILRIYQGTESAPAVIDAEAPVTLADLETQVTTSRLLGARLQQEQEIARAYRLRAGQTADQLVTFEPDTFDRYPNSVSLLSYGNSVLDELLDGVPEPDGDARRGVLRLSTDATIPLVSYYSIDGHGSPARLESLHDLLQVLQSHGIGTSWSDEAYTNARTHFEQLARDICDHIASIGRKRLAGDKSVLIEEAVLLLQRAAAAELVDSGQLDAIDDMRERVTLDPYLFDRLRQRGYPFAALLRIANSHLSGPERLTLSVRLLPTSEQLQQTWSRLKQEGKNLLDRWSSYQPTEEQAAEDLSIRHVYFGV